MTISFFGQYVLLKGIVSRPQLSETIVLQREANQTLAQIALAAGVLSPQQLQTLSLLGCENDTLFSQIVINLGWVGRAALEALHSQQRKTQLALGEALVKKGYLRDNNLPNLLADYHYWNLRNLQRFGAEVSASEFAREADTFSFALTQYMLKVYGLHVKPDCANRKLLPTIPCWSWQIDLADNRLNVVIPDTGAGIARLLNRAELIGSLNLSTLSDTPQEGLGDIPSAMAPAQFFASLLQLLLADMGGQAIRSIDATGAITANGALSEQECLRCSYSIEGELFDVYFCSP